MVKTYKIVQHLVVELTDDEVQALRTLSQIDCRGFNCMKCPLKYNVEETCIKCIASNCYKAWEVSQNE